MGLTSTFPEATKPAAKLAANAQEATDRSLHRATVAFLLFLGFTAVMFGRPADMYWPLAALHMAEVFAIAAIAAYGVTLLQGRAPLVVTTEMKIIAGMTVCFVASIPFAFWRGNAFETLREDWLKTVIIFYLFTQTVFTVDRIKKVFWVIIICMVIIAIFGLTTSRADRRGEDARFGSGTRGFFSGTYSGFAIGMVLPFMAVFFVRSKWIFTPLFLVTAFGLMMMQVVRTASRGSLMSVILALILVWAMVLRHSLKGRLMGLLFVVAMLASLVVAPGVFFDRLQSLWDTKSYATSTATKSAQDSTSQRSMLLKRSIEITLQNPLLGVGVGNFPIVSGTISGNSQDWKGSHNTYTQISSEAGIPALLLFLALLYVSLRSMARIYRSLADRADMTEVVLLARATQASILSFMFSFWFAHLAYDPYLYYVVGTSVVLQAVYNREMERLSAAGSKPGAIGKSASARNDRANRLRAGNGARGRAW